MKSYPLSMNSLMQAWFIHGYRTEFLSTFFNVSKHYGRMIVPAFSIISTISYMLVIAADCQAFFQAVEVKAGTAGEDFYSFCF